MLKTTNLLHVSAFEMNIGNCVFVGFDINSKKLAKKSGKLKNLFKFQKLAKSGKK